MFSVLPVPKAKQRLADPANALAAFPLVGAAIGAAELLWSLACAALGWGIFLRGAGLALIPLALTGGIHMDGFGDTADALASNAGRTRRLEIMSDPHAGAFAVMWINAWLLLYFALCLELGGDFKYILALGAGFVISRSLSGLGLLLLPCAKREGLAKTMADAAGRRATIAVLTGFFVSGAALAVFWAGWAGAMMALCALAVFFVYKRMAINLFGGVTGDLSGWFLQLCELAMAAALVAARGLGAGGV